MTHTHTQAPTSSSLSDSLCLSVARAHTHTHTHIHKFSELQALKQLEAETRAAHNEQTWKSEPKSVADGNFKGTSVPRGRLAQTNCMYCYMHM